MPSNVNVTQANFNAGTGPGNATQDVSVTWTDDAGNPHSDSRVGVTLPVLWNLLTPNQRRVVFQRTSLWMIFLAIGLDNSE